MATQPHTEQPTKSAPEHEERNDALNCNIKAGIALHDIDSLFIAALCVLRQKDEYSDMDEEDKSNALETLMEYGRGAVGDAKEGHQGVWRVTARHLYGQRCKAPKKVAETDQPS
jgi:hypothetical protein